MLHRSLAGLPVIIESPSRFRINTPAQAAAGLRSWVQFISPAEGWTLTWYTPERGLIISNLRWSSAADVAEYLLGLTRSVG